MNPNHPNKTLTRTHSLCENGSTCLYVIETGSILKCVCVFECPVKIHKTKTRAVRREQITNTAFMKPLIFNSFNYHLSDQTWGVHNYVPVINL